MKQYPKHTGSEDERGFTADEIRRNIHLLYADVECTICGKVQSYANANGRCIKCGGETR